MKVDHALEVVREGLGKLSADLTTHQTLQRAVNTLEDEIVRLQTIAERVEVGLGYGTAASTANPPQPQ